MLPEVEEYFKTVEDARRDFHNRDHGSSYSVAADAFQKKLNDAWKTLGEKASDEFLRWLCIEPRITRSYKSHAEEVFKVIPVNLNRLDALANRMDWCGDYNELRTMAITAGALALDFKVEMRYPGRDWRPFRPVHLHGGAMTHKEMGALLAKGIREIQFEMKDGTMYYFRLDPNHSAGMERDRDAK